VIVSATAGKEQRVLQCSNTVDPCTRTADISLAAIWSDELLHTHLVVFAKSSSSSTCTLLEVYKSGWCHICCCLSRFDYVQWPVWRWRWFYVSWFGERTCWVSLQCRFWPSCHRQWWNQLAYLAYLALQKTQEYRRVLYNMQLRYCDDNSHCDIQPQDQGHPEPCCDIQILALAWDKIQISQQCLEPCRPRSWSCKNRPLSIFRPDVIQDDHTRVYYGRPA